jgi:hypothetical protein
VESSTPKLQKQEATSTTPNGGLVVLFIQGLKGKSPSEI